MTMFTVAMKLQKLEGFLQELDTFTNPKIYLEQYPTTPHLAAHMLYTIQINYGDIESKEIADLGCGCGMLTVGSVMLDCKSCIAYDIDPEAVEICQTNINDYDIDNVTTQVKDVREFDPGDAAVYDQVDTVIMNPPFGTKDNEGIDERFLCVALAMTKSAVYALHKRSRRQFFKRKCTEWGVEMKIEAELRYNLDRMYKQHFKDTVDIEVDLTRFRFMGDNKQKFKEHFMKTVSKSS